MAQLRRVLVVGGGIGGLSAAIALRRGGIAEVDVVADIDFERPAGVAFPSMNGLTRTRLHKILQDAVLAGGGERSHRRHVQLARTAG
jgi:NADPH-dependent 2,4-dienoyl-CoA reductase/sulfur reductase-like enzyme